MVRARWEADRLLGPMPDGDLAIVAQTRSRGVHRLAEGRHLRRALKRLRERRVRVAHAREVLGRGTILDGEARLGDELARQRVDDVHTEELVRLLAREHLHEAGLLAVGLGARIGPEHKLALLVLDALGLQLLLRLADPSDLGVSVDHAGHRVVVEVRLLARGQVLGDEGALVLSLMSEHRALDDVADGEDARDVRAVVMVHLDLPALHLHTDIREAQVVGELPAADADEDDVRLRALGASALRGLRLHGQAGARPLHARDLRLHLELHALLFQDGHELLRDLLVDAEAADGVQELDDRDLGAEAGPHRAEL
mmetsp:Transcript_23152/g.65808  ORF Transcript_23152/g.65808 Transcript_23152/m.65808 type:complete len:312 (-) Transcript_23152:158-1093(-)